MKNVKVDELTIEGVVYVPKDSTLKDSKVIELNGDESPWVVGKKYLIRTVTMIQVGKLEKVTDKELVLSSASWIADTGRFTDCLKTGSVSEVELFTNDCIVSRGGIIDATEWSSDLPKEQL